MSTGHQSPQSSLPPLALKTINTTTWGTTGNTSSVITDEYCHPNSKIVWEVTGTQPQAGLPWSISKSQGSFFFTSSDSENASLPISYIIL